MVSHAGVLLIAFVLDWLVGDPPPLWRHLPHPITGFGKAIAFLSAKLNTDPDNEPIALKKGAVAISLLLIGAIVFGLGVSRLVHLFEPIGFLLEVIIVWVFLAQKSLMDHVRAVALALGDDGLKAGRTAVAKIVGRNPDMLDEAGVARAAIESLAENFCDGVVAPAFWYLMFGLPGLLGYKMINTADSMIAYRSAPYTYFGWATAKFDDLANWLPARMSALLIGLAGALRFGWGQGIYAVQTAMRDAGLHRSPNAGWPEAAMAGACDIALGGSRKYPHSIVPQAYINGTGKRELTHADIERAIGVFASACYGLWGLAGGVVLFA